LGKKYFQTVFRWTLVGEKCGLDKENTEQVIDILAKYGKPIDCEKTHPTFSALLGFDLFGWKFGYK